MAAFTTFSRSALERYLVMFGKGDLEAFEPILGGIENSNYFITLNDSDSSTHYVLTIVEQSGFSEVPFFAKVMSRLFQYGMPVAAPLTTLDGMSSTIFCGKPAFLFRKLPGSHPMDISKNHCRAIGEFMATSHNALAGLGATRSNPYGPAWMQAALGEVASRLNTEQYEQLNELVAAYAEIASEDLPRGLIHGDLFRDNALFDESGALTGVIDFYHACDDILIQDVAIALNDWCLGPDGQIDDSLRAAMMDGYQGLRPMSSRELDALLPLQRTSAARFALTRLLSGDPPLKAPEAMLSLAASLTR